MPNFQKTFVFLLILPAFSACFFFRLLTLEMFSGVVLLQLSCGIARLTKAGPVGLPCAPLLTLNLPQFDSLLLHLGTARAEGLGIKGEAGQQDGQGSGLPASQC